MNDTNYSKRVWRTETLKKEAAKQVQIMLAAFLPDGFKVRVERCNSEVPGFPFARAYTYRGTVESDKTDAHFFAEAYSEDGVRAKLLGVILDGGGFYPFT